MPGTILMTVMVGRKRGVLTRRDDHTCVFTAPLYELKPDIEYEVINAGDERYAAAKEIADRQREHDAESQQGAEEKQGKQQRLPHRRK